MVVLVAVTACSKRREEPTLTSAVIEAGSSESDLAHVASEWNRAMSQRDPTLLDQIYGSRVMLYGVPLRHDQVLAIEHVAFDSDPSFTQNITDVHVITNHRVAFDRHWVRFSKSYDERTWLDMTIEHGRWFVTGEDDEASKARSIARAEDAADGGPRAFCSTEAENVALSTMEGRALLQGPPGHTRIDTVASPPEFPAYAVAITTNIPTPTTLAWFDIEPCFIDSPAPNTKPTAGSCVTPGNSPGAISNGLDGKVLDADPHTLIAMSRCKP
jgi:hypothetical protein